MILYQMYVLHEGTARLTELLELERVHSDMNLTCSLEEFKDTIRNFDWAKSSYDDFIQCYTEYRLDHDDPYVLLIFRVDSMRADLAAHFEKVKILIDLNSKLFGNFIVVENNHGTNKTLH